jgi:hypothetical protein
MTLLYPTLSASFAGLEHAASLAAGRAWRSRFGDSAASLLAAFSPLSCT